MAPALGTDDVSRCEHTCIGKLQVRRAHELAENRANGRLKDRVDLPHGGFNGFLNGHRRCVSSDISNGVSNDLSHYAPLHPRIRPPQEDKMEPIAVIGLALRFPQDATSPEAFWQMLMQGRSAMTDVPKERFNIDAFHCSGMNKTQGLINRGGHFIKDDLAGFDSPFFSMAPAEVSCMDPQQRWLLEVAYEALENAGVPIEQAIGSKTSVHIGSFLREYEIMLSKDTQMPAKYKATGTALSMLANRLSWFYDFTGPSIALDTACSSSLNALHLACQSLRLGESTMGLVGGCNLIYNSDTMKGLSDLEFLSPDSKCYSFDHRANGYSRGEGFGIIIIKPLSKALEDGDTIRAVIRATGVNQDGRTPGITQPSCKAQEALIQETYKAGGLDMSKTRYFEAHGTGTPIGDSIEARAINSAFNNGRKLEEPLYIGAVKSNIGHLEGASGIAGLIKAILVLEKGIIPPNIWFERPNSQIPLQKWNIKFPLASTPWPTDGLRRASVNSFGFGGSNAHAVLDDAYNYLRLRNLRGKHRTEITPPKQGTLIALSDTISAPSDGIEQALTNKLNNNSKPALFVWSASEESGLARMGGIYQNYLQTLPFQNNESKFVTDLAYTLSDKRSRLPWKSFLVARSINDLNQQLELGLPKPTRSVKTPKLGFIFTGQGAQWYAMGRELLEYSVFRESLEDAQIFFRGLGAAWMLIDELLRTEGSSKIDDPAFSQPICTALQIALVELLSSWGVAPAAVVGHSSGEIAAAYCVGGITRDSAWRVAYYRGVVAALVTKPNQDSGAMMSVGLSEEAIEPYLQVTRSVGGNISVGCVNSPRNITLSGSKKQIDVLSEALKRDHVFFQKLKVNVAYHSQMMKEVALIYEMLIRNIEAGEGPFINAPLMFSSVTGLLLPIEELMYSKYWVKNLVSQVKFSQAVTHICLQSSKKLARTLNANESIKVNHLLEIGPHAALQGILRDILNTQAKSGNISYSSMLVRGRSAIDTALETAGGLFCLGTPVNLSQINVSRQTSLTPRMLTDLPAYPFNHTKKYWLESRLSKNFRFRKYPHHELLGTPAPDWNPLEARWRNIITLKETQWIKDHKVNGSEVYPAAGMLVMAIEAARQLADSAQPIAGYSFKNVAFHKALVIPSAAEGIEVQFHLRPVNEKSGHFLTWSDFRLCVYENSEWSDICHGAIAVEYIQEQTTAEIGRNLEIGDEQYPQNSITNTKTCNIAMKSRHLYETLDKAGLTYGPSFQSIQDVCYNDDGEATAFIDLREWMTKTPDNEIQPHVIHPAALDAIFQLSFVSLSKGGQDLFPTMVPTKIRTLYISERKNGVRAYENHVGRSNDTRVKVHTKIKTVGLRNAEFSILAFDSDNGKPCVIGGIETTSVAGLEASTNNEAGMRRLCYNMDWKPDVDLLSDDQLSSYCSAVTSAPLSVSEEMVQENRMVCYLALLKATEELQPDEFYREKPHLLRYAEWMKYHLSTDAISSLGDTCADWRDSVDREAYLENLCSKVERSSVEGKVIVRIIRNLSMILQGKVDALELLFNDSLMEDYYRYTHTATTAFGQLSTYVDAYAHKNPDLRILEIGAGTGGATTDILDTLNLHEAQELTNARFAEYVFTDISSSFFENAKKKFSAHADRMVFSTLNIEKDPLEQQFEAENYDVIIASNVLHATTNLATTLKNARKLLKPGGKLILYELIDPASILPGFIFGLLPGWWLGTEDDRKLGPLITEDSWHDKLSECGFSGVNVSHRGYIGEQRHICSAIISTAIEPTEIYKSTVTSTIIITGHSPLQSSIAGELQSRLEETGQSDCTIISVLEIASIDFGKANCIFLSEMEHSFLRGITDDAYTGLQRIVTSANSLLWITSSDNESPVDPANNMVVGLARCIQGENPKLRITTLALETHRDTCQAVQNIYKVFLTTLQTSDGEPEMEYAERNGMLCINRVVEARAINQHIFSKTNTPEPELRPFRRDSLRPIKLTVSSPGLLESLQFVDDPLAGQPVAADEIEVEVKASGLNFRDVLIALGQDNSTCLGYECAGVVRQAGVDTKFKLGDRVCCLVEGSFATYATCTAVDAVVMPDDMTFASAAGLPVTYATAYYVIMDRARMKPGESILIHSGAGGLGQACIQIAKLFDADIYVTVGSDEKRQLLKDQYGISDDHIFSSRTPAFAQKIKNMTNGRGVDIIVNSLAGEALKASWECIAPFGRFLETGKKDIFSYGTLPMFPFAKNTAFLGVDLFYVKRNTKGVVSELMQAVMSLVKDKKITLPSPLTVFSASQIEEAFRCMQSGKSKGKIVIEFHDDDLVPTVPSMLPTYGFDENATYLISGGFGGLGRSIARWMASRGAKHMILLSRSGPQSEAAQLLMGELKAQNVNVAAPLCDVSDMQMMSSVLEECNKTMPPIKGCIQGSMVLKDATFANMSLEQFNAAVKPKVEGSWNLHTLLPKGMDFFILLSSLSGVAGLYGQSNYASGNTYQDGLAQYRIAHGEKAVALDLGNMLSVGYVAEREGLAEALQSQFFMGVEESEFHALLDYYCDPILPLLSSAQSQVIVGLEVPAVLHSKHIEEPFWMRRPLFKQLYQIESQKASPTPDAEAAISYEAVFQAAESLAEVGERIVDGLRTKLSRTLAMEKENIDAGRPMHTYGVDSLAAVELRTWFRRVIGAEMTVFEILGNGSIASLAMTVAGKSRFVKADLKGELEGE